MNDSPAVGRPQGPGGGTRPVHPAVVMLTASFHPHLGGAERQALALSKALARKGVPVRVLTRRLPGTPARAVVEGIPVRRLPAPGSGLLNSAVFLLSSLAWLVLHAPEFDAVHVHLAGSPALAAALVGRLTGKAVVIKVGGGRGIGEVAVSARSWPGRLKLALLALLEPRFVAVTEDLALELAEHSLGPAQVVPNGVDIEAFHPASPTERAELRARWGLGEGPAFLYMGRISVEKRLPAFAAAFGRATAGVSPRPRLVAAGSGPEEAALREAARAAGVDLLLLPTQEDPPPLYRACDAFVLPSVSEGLSNALLEAMASGLAVVASRVGGTAEAVEDGVSGLLFDPADAAAEEGAVRRLLAEPGLAARLGSAARERALSRYALDAVAERYLKLYNPG
ncbi:MAG: glycosyltransferase family 4 protein [Elusimicrobia bacterium]|nr:glycosyltransferase family 4 protein [Elusimicrobiota bacterium]